MNKVEYLHPQLQEMLGLPASVVVEYTMFDPNRDLPAVRLNNPRQPVLPLILGRPSATMRNTTLRLSTSRRTCSHRATIPMRHFSINTRWIGAPSSLAASLLMPRRMSSRICSRRLVKYWISSWSRSRLHPMACAPGALGCIYLSLILLHFSPPSVCLRGIRSSRRSGSGHQELCKSSLASRGV